MEEHGLVKRNSAHVFTIGRQILIILTPLNRVFYARKESCMAVAASTRDSVVIVSAHGRNQLARLARVGIRNFVV